MPVSSAVSPPSIPAGRRRVIRFSIDFAINHVIDRSQFLHSIVDGDASKAYLKTT
jgi:hypothetical protein